MYRGNILLRRAPLAAGAMLAALAAPSPALATEAEPYAAPRDRASYDTALRCLTEAIYFEARSEADDGQRAVAQVVLNRVRHRSYPNSVCGVVYQGSQRRTGCQFTFTCDGSLARGVSDNGSWARAARIANAALRGYVYEPVGLALNYHTTAIRPYWAPSLIRHSVIGAHIFYRQPGAGEAAFNQAPSRTEAYRQAPMVEAREAPLSSGGRVRPGRAGARPNYSYAVEQVQQMRIERPTVERAVYAGSVGVGTRRAQRPAAAQAQVPARATQPAAARGPRQTMERGVRVARGS